MVRWVMRYLRRKRALDRRMKEFERNGMRGVRADRLPRSRWM